MKVCKCGLEIDKGKMIVWLLWELQLVDIEGSKVQMQHLRVAASSEKNVNIYMQMFKRDRKNRSCVTKDTQFVIEKRELDHAFGFRDLSHDVHRKRKPHKFNPFCGCKICEGINGLELNLHNVKVLMVRNE